MNRNSPVRSADRGACGQGRSRRAPLRIFALTCALAWVGLPVAPAIAQGALSGVASVPADLRPRLNLDASATREIAQDRALVVLYAERESADAAVSQAEVNRLLTPALERLKNTPDIDVQTSAYRTEPVWQQSRITAWRTRGSVQITGKPSEAFNALVGELSATLNIQSLTWQLSRDAHLAAERELIAQAIEAFRAKADAAAGAMGFRAWEFGELTLDGSTPDAGPTPRLAMMATRASEAMPLPGVEGRTTVTVGLRGNVILLH